ncbi:MAG: hypothetical protein KY428_04725 [Bacteroidetes bacterium]|nr:hypothetical protein [Bacteroidota bacterium]
MQRSSRAGQVLFVAVEDNLRLDLIRQKFEGLQQQFRFDKWEKAFEQLLQRT